MDKKIQQKLADRLYELLPHKKELEFGCQFIWKEDLTDKDSYCAVFENWVTRNETVRCMTRPFFTQAVVEKSHITEIIGQPLRLADVLLAMDDYAKGDLKVIENNLIAIYNKYNLSKDNILNQSDEFCEFVLGLLAN